MSNPNPSPKTRFKKGESGNPGGRVKDTLKEYARKYFIKMTDDEKLAFIKKISPDKVWSMAEGNPHQTADEKIEVKVIPFDDI